MSNIFENPSTNLGQEFMSFNQQEQVVLQEYADHCFRLIDGTEPQEGAGDTAEYSKWYRTGSGLLEVGVRTTPQEFHEKDFESLGLDIFNADFCYLSVYTVLHDDPVEVEGIVEVDWDSGIVNDIDDVKGHNAVLGSLSVTNSIPEDEDLPQRDLRRGQNQKNAEDERARKAEVEANEGFDQNLSLEVRAAVKDLRELVSLTLRDVEPDENQPSVQWRSLEIETPDYFRLVTAATRIAVYQIMPSPGDIEVLGKFAVPRILVEKNTCYPVVADEDINNPRLLVTTQFLEIIPDSYPILWNSSEVYNVEHNEEEPKLRRVLTDREEHLFAMLHSADDSVVAEARRQLKSGLGDDREGKGTEADIIEAQELVKKYFLGI